jgi:signal transduction histidine kinase
MRLPTVITRARGVRLRSALAAALVVAVAAVLAGGVLLYVGRNVLVSNVTTAATDTAAPLVATLSSGEEPVLGASPSRAVVQVIGTAGDIFRASPSIAGAPPVSQLRPAAGVQQWGYTELGEVEYRVLAEGVGTRSGTQTVLVAVSLDTVDDGTEAIAAALIIGLPLLVLVVAVATFLFVGRTLRPVEAMTRRAAGITATNLHERLPVPEAKDEIAALAATMNTMLDRIEAGSAAQRRFVADASHELRSPLATIHANADLLLALPLEAEPARSVERIQAESSRMTTLVEDLLLLARAADHQLRVRRDDVDLDDLVYAERDRVAIEHPGLEVDGEVNPVRVSGDADQLHRLLRNLVDNAVRHARTRVTLALGDDGLVVGNDGPPIAPADRERIFDRFVRLDDSRSREGGGTGLGLAIAREIAEAHDGTLAVDDLTEGAAMRLILQAVGS